MNRIHYRKNKPIIDLFKEDLLALKHLPEIPFEVFKLQRGTADKYGKIRYDKKLYSTAPAFAGREVWIKATSSEIIILDDNNNLIQKHKRLYGEQTESINWTPYIELIAKRPTSFMYTGFFKQLPQTIQKYFEQLQYQEKKIILNTLNRMINETDIDTAVTAFSLALEEGLKDADSIWTTFYTLTTQPVIAKDLEINNPNVPNIIPFDINMKKYDALMKGGEKVCSKQ